MSSNPFDRFFPADFQLETPRVQLRPMQLSDIEIYKSLANEPDLWKYFTKDLMDPHEMEQWVKDALDEKMKFTRMPFTVIDKDTKTVCGSTSYGNISFFDKRIEIGWTWLGKEYIGMGVNRQAKFALLSYAFEVMKMERVEIKTDYLNERARAALIKVGMKPEGVLRSHMQMHSNRRRDTIYFSILKDEWPERKNNFFADLCYA
ncbi:MAG TPA: GNAT family protein [Flavitalea sp.]|nr:GNAT family protein [Flavitalea sp.]